MQQATASASTHSVQGIDPALAPLLGTVLKLCDGPRLPAQFGTGTPQHDAALYALGYELYQQGRYEEALQAFGLLTLRDPTDPRYLLAAGATLQMQRLFEQALTLYGLAAFLRPADPVAPLHACECLIALGRLDEAREALADLLPDCEPGRHDPIRHRAEGLRQFLAQQAPDGKDGQ